MGEVSTIGLDIAKSIFQIHGVDVDGAVVIANALAERSCWSSLRRCRPASSASKHVRARIIGAGGLRRSATR